MSSAMPELQRNVLQNMRRQEQNMIIHSMTLNRMNAKMEDNGMGRCLAMIQRETEMEKFFQEKSDHAAIVNKQAAKEIALGREIAQIQHDKICKQMRSLYLRDNDEGLKDLQKKLQAGYVSKDLKKQILDNEYRRQREKIEEAKAMSQIRDTILATEVVRKAEQDTLDAKFKYRRELQQQLVDRQMQKHCQYEDTLIEKKMLDEIMKAIAEEDKKELELKQKTKERIHREMEMTKLAKDAWKAKQKQLLLKEELELEKQIAAAEQRKSGASDERARKNAIKEANNRRIVEKLLAEKREVDERNDLICMLREQEHLEKVINEEIDEKIKLAESKRTTREELMKQMGQRKVEAIEQMKRDLELKQWNDERYNEQLEKEREKERKKKESNRKYSQELLQQMKNNQIKRQREKANEEARAQYTRDSVKQWDKEIAVERAAIIKQHAPKLLGSITAGVLQPSDLPVVREGANEDPELSKLDIESLATPKKPRPFPKCNVQCMMLKKY